MRPPRRTCPILLVLATALSGCAARRERLMGTPPAADPPRAVARPGASGYASFGGRASLRADTPSLTALQDEAKAREPAYVEVPYGAAGPEGDPGVGSYYDPWASSANWGVVPPGYLYPGGAVPPGLRAPSPLTQPFHRAFPNSDVTYHRPGLSTGSGVHGREATDAQRWPQLFRPR